MQSSAALLGRQRGPGLGYWSTGNAPDAIGPLSPASSRPPGSSRPDSAVVKSHDEEVNLEYLRNVIFQFLEHKEMRVRLLQNRVITNTENVLLCEAGFGSRVVDHFTIHTTRDSQTDRESMTVSLLLLCWNN